MRGSGDLSLRSKMILGGLAIVLIPLIIVAAVTFVNSSRTLEEISRLQAAQIAQSLSGIIQLAIEKELHILSATAADPLVVKAAAARNFGAIEPKLVDLYGKIGMDYEGLAVYDDEGTIRVDGVDRNRIGLSIATRGYFARARQGKSGVGPPNNSMATGEPIFGLSAPIRSPEGQFVGGVLGVIKADFLVRHIASMRLGKTGYAFMVDQNGVVIAHPDKSYILKLNMSHEEGMAEIAKRMLHLETGTEEYVFRGTRKVAGFAPVELTGWSIGVTQNRDEIMALAYANRDFILLVCGVSLGITLLAVLFFSRTISTPVQKMLTTLNQALEQASEAIFIIGLDRRVQYANPATAAVFERPVGDLYGQTPLLENTQGISAEEIWATLEDGRVWNGTVTGSRKDRTPFFLDMAITPVRGEAGAINSFLAVGRDITRELKLDEQIRRGQRMEALGTLAGGIAHDFNNILGAIFGLTELAMISLADREKVSHLLAETMEAAERARDLIARIMTFSRRAEPQKKPLVPKRVVMEALKLLRASLPTTIELRATLISEAVILGDPTQMHQVVLNLCTNAGHAMRDGGGVLEVRLDDFDVDEALAVLHPGLKPGRHMRLTVSDTGHGIPAENVERIFDPFFTTKLPGEGTGLGLSVVHSIVRMLDGEITVASQVGTGTTFTVLLPVISEESPIVSDQVDAEVPRGTERILLVDDEEALARTVKSLLESLGYKVCEFSRSLAAWEEFSKRPHDFDAVLTDYTMPQMTGYELARKLRSVRADIPIILCSGYVDAALEEKIRQAHITELIMKPITRRDIALALRKAMAQAARK